MKRFRERIYVDELDRNPVRILIVQYYGETLGDDMSTES